MWTKDCFGDLCWEDSVKIEPAPKDLVYHTKDPYNKRMGMSKSEFKAKYGRLPCKSKTAEEIVKNFNDLKNAKNALHATKVPMPTAVIVDSYDVFIDEWFNKDIVARERLSEFLDTSTNESVFSLCIPSTPAKPKSLRVKPTEVKPAPCNLTTTPTGDNTMSAYLSGSSPIDIQQRNYLLTAAERAMYAKLSEAEKAFNLLDDDPPRTPKEAVDRIIAGKYVIPKKDPDTDDDEDEYYGSPLGYIRWRDPAATPNKDGYKAAEKALTAAKNDADLAIMTGTIADGAAALTAFKATTIH